MLPRNAPREEGRYFFAFFVVPVLASARRSVFLRRAARFFTLSLPWLFPIRPSPSPFRGRFQVISLNQENEAGDFSYIKLDVPHEVFNMSDTEPVVAFVARSSAEEWDKVIPYDRNQDGAVPS